MANRINEFTHANTGEKVFIDMGVVFAVWFSRAHRCTLIEATGQAILPVREEVDFVKKLWDSVLKEEK